MILKFSNLFLLKRIKKQKNLRLMINTFLRILINQIAFLISYL